MNEIKKHKNGFSFNEVQTFRGRERYFLNGEVVALQCTSCKEAFEPEKFFNQKGGFLNKKNTCKKCYSKLTKEWKMRNPERVKEHDKRWNSSLEQTASNHNSRAEKHGNKGLLTEHMIEQMFFIATRIENGQKVIYCQISGKPIESKAYLGHCIAVDQVGGDSSLKNMVVISPAVNNAQGNMNILEFLLTPKGQEMADKEQVRWTVHYLANLNSKSVEQYLFSQLEFEEAIQFQKIYLEGIRVLNWD